MFTYNHVTRSATQRLKVTVGMLAVLLILTVLPVAAQNAPSRNNSAAALHIRINVVPIVFSPVRDHTDSTNGTSVVYAIPAKTPQTEVIEQVSTVEIQQNAGVSSKVLLKTTTVIPQ